MNAPEIWTPKEIASLLRYSVRHVSERITQTKGFPKPIAGGNAGKRWLKDDVLNWVCNKR